MDAQVIAALPTVVKQCETPSHTARAVIQAWDATKSLTSRHTLVNWLLMRPEESAAQAVASAGVAPPTASTALLCAAQAGRVTVHSSADDVISIVRTMLAASTVDSMPGLGSGPARSTSNASSLSVSGLAQAYHAAVRHVSMISSLSEALGDDGAQRLLARIAAFVNAASARCFHDGGNIRQSRAGERRSRIGASALASFTAPVRWVKATRQAVAVMCRMVGQDGSDEAAEQVLASTALPRLLRLVRQGIPGAQLPLDEAEATPSNSAVDDHSQVARPASKAHRLWEAGAELDCSVLVLLVLVQRRMGPEAARLLIRAGASEAVGSALARRATDTSHMIREPVVLGTASTMTMGMGNGGARSDSAMRMASMTPGGASLERLLGPLVSARQLAPSGIPSKRPDSEGRSLLLASAASTAWSESLVSHAAASTSAVGVRMQQQSVPGGPSWQSWSDDMPPSSSSSSSSSSFPALGVAALGAGVGVERGEAIARVLCDSWGPPAGASLGAAGAEAVHILGQRALLGMAGAPAWAARSGTAGGSEAVVWLEEVARAAVALLLGRGVSDPRRSERPAAARGDTPLHPQGAVLLTGVMPVGEGQAVSFNDRAPTSSITSGAIVATGLLERGMLTTPSLSLSHIPRDIATVGALLVAPRLSAGIVLACLRASFQSAVLGLPPASVPLQAAPPAESARTSTQSGDTNGSLRAVSDAEAASLTPALEAAAARSRCWPIIVPATVASLRCLASRWLLQACRANDAVEDKVRFAALAEAARAAAKANPLSHLARAPPPALVSTRSSRRTRGIGRRSFAFSGTPSSSGATPLTIPTTPLSQPPTPSPSPSPSPSPVSPLPTSQTSPNASAVDMWGTKSSAAGPMAAATAPTPTETPSGGIPTRFVAVRQSHTSRRRNSSVGGAIAAVVASGKAAGSNRQLYHASDWCAKGLAVVPRCAQTVDSALERLISAASGHVVASDLAGDSTTGLTLLLRAVAARLLEIVSVAAMPVPPTELPAEPSPKHPMPRGAIDCAVQIVDVCSDCRLPEVCADVMLAWSAVCGSGVDKKPAGELPHWEDACLAAVMLSILCQADIWVAGESHATSSGSAVDSALFGACQKSRQQVLPVLGQRLAAAIGLPSLRPAIELETRQASLRSLPGFGRANPVTCRRALRRLARRYSPGWMLIGGKLSKASDEPALSPTGRSRRHLSKPPKHARTGSSHPDGRPAHRGRRLRPADKHSSKAPASSKHHDDRTKPKQPFAADEEEILGGGDVAQQVSLPPRLLAVSLLEELLFALERTAAGEEEDDDDDDDNANDIDDASGHQRGVEDMWGGGSSTGSPTSPRSTVTPWRMSPRASPRAVSTPMAAPVVTEEGVESPGMQATDPRPLPPHRERQARDKAPPVLSKWGVDDLRLHGVPRDIARACAAMVVPGQKYRGTHKPPEQPAHRLSAARLAAVVRTPFKATGKVPPAPPVSDGGSIGSGTRDLTANKTSDSASSKANSPQTPKPPSPAGSKASPSVLTGSLQGGSIMHKPASSSPIHSIHSDDESVGSSASASTESTSASVLLEHRDAAVDPAVRHVRRWARALARDRASRDTITGQQQSESKLMSDGEHAQVDGIVIGDATTEEADLGGDDPVPRLPKRFREVLQSDSFAQYDGPLRMYRERIEIGGGLEVASALEVELQERQLLAKAQALAAAGRGGGLQETKTAQEPAADRVGTAASASSAAPSLTGLLLAARPATGRASDDAIETALAILAATPDDTLGAAALAAIPQARGASKSVTLSVDQSGGGGGSARGISRGEAIEVQGSKTTTKPIVGSVEFASAAELLRAATDATLRSVSRGKRASTALHAPITMRRPGSTLLRQDMPSARGKGRRNITGLPYGGGGLGGFIVEDENESDEGSDDEDAGPTGSKTTDVLLRLATALAGGSIAEGAGLLLDMRRGVGAVVTGSAGRGRHAYKQRMEQVIPQSMDQRLPGTRFAEAPDIYRAGLEAEAAAVVLGTAAGRRWAAAGIVSPRDVTDELQAGLQETVLKVRRGDVDDRFSQYLDPAAGTEAGSVKASLLRPGLGASAHAGIAAKRRKDARALMAAKPKKAVSSLVLAGTASHAMASLSAREPEAASRRRRAQMPRADASCRAAGPLVSSKDRSEIRRSFTPLRVQSRSGAVRRSNLLVKIGSTAVTG